MAKITKRLCLEVGEYLPEGEDKPKKEYRDIGLMIEFEDRAGNRWHEVKLFADVLNPSLFALARQQMRRGESSARVKLFDVSRRQNAPEPAATPPNPDADGYDGIPY